MSNLAEPESSCRVVLIDDHDLLRRGIKTMLESEPDMQVVGEGSDGSEALELVESYMPDVVLIDVIMPNKDGIEATKEIKDSFPKVGVVVLSGHDERQFIFDALKAGASGYLLKTAELDEVIATVRSVAHGEAKLDPTLASQVLTEFQTYQTAEVSEVYQPLTPREGDPPADERRSPEQDDRSPTQYLGANGDYARREHLLEAPREQPRVRDPGSDAAQTARPELNDVVPGRISSAPAGTSIGRSPHRVGSRTPTSRRSRRCSRDPRSGPGSDQAGATTPI